MPSVAFNQFLLTLNSAAAATARPTAAENPHRQRSRVNRSLAGVANHFASTAHDAAGDAAHGLTRAGVATLGDRAETRTSTRAGAVLAAGRRLGRSRSRIRQHAGLFAAERNTARTHNRSNQSKTHLSLSSLVRWVSPLVNHPNHHRPNQDQN